MNIDNYKFSNNKKINEEVKEKMRKISYLANERVRNKRFPDFANIKFGKAEEKELIETISEIEEIYKKYDDITHHKSRLYVLEKNRKGYKVYHNTSCGTDNITTPPIGGGKTAKEALKSAWQGWSIPPVLIINANYYMGGDISIKEIINW